MFMFKHSVPRVFLTTGILLSFQLCIMSLPSSQYAKLKDHFLIVATNSTSLTTPRFTNYKKAVLKADVCLFKNPTFPAVLALVWRPKPIQFQRLLKINLTFTNLLLFTITSSLA